MAQYIMPDGNGYEFASDAEATKAMAAWKSQYDQKPTFIDKLSGYANIAKNIVQEGAGAIAEPIMKIGSGMLAKPISEVAGLAAMGSDMSTGNKNGDPQGFKNYVQQALTYQPRTTLGSSQYNPLNAIPEAIGQGIAIPTNRAADFISGGQSADSVRGMFGNAVREAIPQAIGLATMKTAPIVGNAAQNSLIRKQTALDTLKGQSSATDAVIQSGKNAGYKFTPDELSKFGAGHPVGSGLEDVSALHVYHLNREAGSMDAAASIKNYPNTVKLAREELIQPNKQSFPANTALSDKTLDTFIEQHGKVYAAVEKQPGQIVYNKYPDYIDAINNLQGDLSAAIKQYPDLMNTEGVKTLQDSLLSGKPVGAGTKYIGYETEHGMPYNQTTSASTNPAAAMQLIKKLRADANKVLSMNEVKPEALSLARVQKKAATAVENMLGNYLKDNGKKELFNSFKNSREQIAKAYELKNALDGGTVLDAQKLARNGDGLTGNLKIIQDMALQHPNLMMDPRTVSTAGRGVLAGAAVGATLAASGYPKAGIAVAARPWLSPVMMSKVGQNMFAKTPSYQVNPILSGAATGLPYAQGMFGAQIPYLTQQGQQQ